MPEYRPQSYEIEIGQVEAQLRSISEYACSADRRLKSIDMNTEPAYVRFHERIEMPPSCPGEPGYAR